MEMSRRMSFSLKTSMAALTRSSVEEVIVMFSSPCHAMDVSVPRKSKRVASSLAAWFSALSTSWRSTLLTTSNDESAIGSVPPGWGLFGNLGTFSSYRFGRTKAGCPPADRGPHTAFANAVARAAPRLMVGLLSGRGGEHGGENSVRALPAGRTTGPRRDGRSVASSRHSHRPNRCDQSLAAGIGQRRCLSAAVPARGPGGGAAQRTTCDSYPWLRRHRWSPVCRHAPDRGPRSGDHSPRGAPGTRAGGDDHRPGRPGAACGAQGETGAPRCEAVQRLGQRVRLRLLD